MPCCAFTDAIIVDGQLNHLYDSLWKSNYRNPEDAKDVYRYAVYRQAALGCTMIFNNGARRYALQNKQFPFRRGQHDRFVVYLCAAFGKVTYLDKPLIKYRQHGKNVTSYINKTQTRFSVVENILLSPKKVHSHLSDNFGRLKMLPINVSYAKIFVMLIQKWIFTSKWKKIVINGKIKKLIIIGAGGMGRTIYSNALECVGYGEVYEVKGFIDDDLNALDDFENYPPSAGNNKGLSAKGG